MYNVKQKARIMIKKFINEVSFVAYISPRNIPVIISHGVFPDWMKRYIETMDPKLKKTKSVS
jgi:hypothetical protein